MSKTVLSIGAGYPQLEFIRSLKEKGHRVVALGKGRNSEEAISLADEFYNISTHDVEEVLAWLKSYSKKIDAVGSFAGGKAILSLQLCSNLLRTATSIPKELVSGMDKFSQQAIYRKYGISNIKTWNCEDLLNNPEDLNYCQKYIVKPSEGRGSEGIQVVNRDELKYLLLNKKLKPQAAVQEFIEGIEYRLLLLFQDKQIKVLVPVLRKSHTNTVFLGRLEYSRQDFIRIKTYFSKFIQSSGLNDGILKADILVSAERIDMIEMDLGVGGGIYYKKYISAVLNYDLNQAYIKLILGEKVQEACEPANRLIMDYVYNKSGSPIELDMPLIQSELDNLLGPCVILKNLLSPELHGKFSSNAHFIFTIIHEKREVSNDEVNRRMNQLFA